MRTSLALLLAIAALSSCRVSKDPFRNTARQLQNGRLQEDTSWVYQLPYEAGSSHLVLQGYFSRLSHRNRAALDFAMKKGTEIYAARGGVVIRLQEQHNKGGWNRKYRQYANMVVIQHEDGTRAGYWHLAQNGVLVNLGDTVKTGRLIAISGKTGYSATPHLHFMVWKNVGSRWIQVPTRFMTRKGPSYLRPLRWYRNKNKPR